MTNGINNIIYKKKEKLPNTLTESKTVMIQKKINPIVLTNVTYKLFIGILKYKMESYIQEIRQDSEVQAGFSRHRRNADNLFTLD